MAGLTLHSRGTRCRATAAQWHISVVTLKDLFTAHRRTHVDSSMEEACIAAFAQARLQKIYFPGEQFSFSFRVKSGKQEQQTPAVHNLELALQHRKQILSVLDKRSALDKRTQRITELRSRLKQSSIANKNAWQARMYGMQKQLLGYISCELHNRKGVKTLRGSRFRLQGKQSVRRCHEGTMVLPWLAGLVVDQSKNKVEVQEGLRAFLESDGITSLRHFLHSAVHTHLAQPQLSLDDAKPCVPDGNSGRKRKSTSMRSDPHAEVQGHSWRPRLRPRVARPGK